MAQNVFQFLVEPSLQELFRDKDTGLPMANGELTFFKDNDRTPTGMKPVYKLTGTPADPVYVALPNPLPLTGVGSTSDGFGTDTKVYYNPFDENGDPELYYIEVRNEQGVLQFTREGWPQQIPIESNIDFSFIENFMQDGQFLHHLDVPDSGLIVDEITNISYGGWVYIVSSGFSSVNNVTFSRFTDFVDSPAVSPRYALNVQVTSPNPAETKKDITWVNNNVNFLAGETATMQFEAVSNNGIASTVDIFYEKLYGTGGSASEEEFVATIEIQPTVWGKYPVIINIKDNLEKIIGPNDDDEIRFIIRLTTDASLNLSFVNMMLVEGEFSTLNYPQTSDYDASLKALASSIDGPAFDNSDAGKVLTLGGRTDTEVGQSGTPLAALVWANAVPTGFISETYLDPSTIVPGYLYCDGDSYDLVGPTETDSNITVNNSLFSAIGTAAGYGSQTYLSTKTIASQYTLTCTVFGVATAPDVGATGFTAAITTPGAPAVFQIVQVDTVAANVIPVSSVLEVFSPSGRSTKYWFEIDGIGTAPTPVGTELIKQISLASTDTADQVADILVANTITQVRVPDKRSSFSRGLDDGKGLDPDAASRTDPTFGNVVGSVVGSLESFALEEHTHNVTPLSPTGASAATEFVGVGGTTPTSGVIGATISTETRPLNDNVTYFIKT
jgi:hypothetical protein